MPQSNPCKEFCKQLRSIAQVELGLWLFSSSCCSLLLVWISLWCQSAAGFSSESPIGPRCKEVSLLVFSLTHHHRLCPLLITWSPVHVWTYTHMPQTTWLLTPFNHVITHSWHACMVLCTIDVIMWSPVHIWSYTHATNYMTIDTFSSRDYRFMLGPIHMPQTTWLTDTFSLCDHRFMYGPMHKQHKSGSFQESSLLCTVCTPLWNELIHTYPR